MKIIQITDTHMVPPGCALLGFDPRQRLEACIADVNRRHSDADLCILTGDLADHGDPAAYGQLREGLAKLALPWRLMIGNHDDRENFKAAFPESPCDLNGFVQSGLDSPAGRLLLLDTHEPGERGGSYCEARAAWLAEALDQAGDQPVYLFLHHPPFDVHVPSLDVMRLLDPSHLVRAIEGHDSIRHLFFGHIHRQMSGTWRGLPFSAIRSTVHQVALDYDDPRITYSLESPQYGVIFLEPERVVVQTEDFLARSGISKDTPRYGDLP